MASLYLNDERRRAHWKQMMIQHARQFEASGIDRLKGQVNKQKLKSKNNQWTTLFLRLHQAWQRKKCQSMKPVFIITSNSDFKTSWGWSCYICLDTFEIILKWPEIPKARQPCMRLATHINHLQRPIIWYIINSVQYAK